MTEVDQALTAAPAKDKGCIASVIRLSQSASTGKACFRFKCCLMGNTTWGSCTEVPAILADLSVTHLLLLPTLQLSPRELFQSGSRSPDSTNRAPTQANASNAAAHSNCNDVLPLSPVQGPEAASALPQAQQQQLHAARHLSFTGSNANHSILSNSSLASGSFTSSGNPSVILNVPGSPPAANVASFANAAVAAAAAAAATQQLRSSSSSLQVGRGGLLQQHVHSCGRSVCDCIRIEASVLLHTYGLPHVEESCGFWAATASQSWRQSHELCHILHARLCQQVVVLSYKNLPRLNW